MNKHMLSKLLGFGIIALFVILIFNTFFVFSLRSSLDEKIAEATEKAKPALVEVITLTSTSSCKDCFNITAVAAQLPGAHLNISKEETLAGDSEEGKALIQQYQIDKLPTIIIRGKTEQDIEKVSIQGFTRVDKALRFDALVPPYQNAITQQVMGKVQVVIINDQRCDDCSSMSLIVDNLKQSGVVVDTQKALDASAASDIVDKYNITKLPALLLSQDIDVYPISARLKQSGIKSREGFYVIESSAPYVEVSSGKMRGSVNLLIVEDKQCTECYDTTILEQVSSQLGLFVKQTKKVDVNSAEGVDVRLKYKLQKVPTMILTGDIAAYPGFDKIWAQAGSVEDDGAYVFRSIELLGESIRFKDLTTGKVSGRTTTS